ncbi:MAG TPA: glycoside hydrolase family 2 protein [Clostridiales bacterium]|nr:glycoside hydrolase family 2 protein [Clostridiales bacterium]
MNTADTRGIYNINLDWKFLLGDDPGAWHKGYDDSGWRTVNLPHDWAVEHPFDIKHSSGTGYLPGGTGIYRKRFYLPKELEGKRVYVKFDGVYNNSMVWFNSYYLGKRPSGYAEFIYDITDFACFGDNPNVLVVRVDHKHVADSRWYTGSGIYRKVTVIVKDRICVDNYGVFVSTKALSKDTAELDIKASVINTTGRDADVVIKYYLYDDNKVASSLEQKQILSPYSSITDQQVMIVSRPKLWSTESPYLYRFVTEIEMDGRVIDREETSIGIRTIKFDANRGFFLNGQNMKLKGVCVHHDAGCLGAAVRKKVWERRLLALKEMGCNAIRMSHNPHMPELYDLCDSMGFLVFEEAFDEWEGVKNKWSQGHNVYPPVHYGYYEDFHDWHERDLAAMVLRGRNHPSIILWSIGNEIDYPNDPYCHPAFKILTGNNDANKPAQERLYDANRPNAERLVTIAKELVSIVKKYDTTRPVTAALACPELSNVIGLADCLDVVGYNYKEHLYEEDHKRYPERIIMGSENGKELDQWLAVKNNDYISGQFLWTGIDYLGETRGWPSHGSEAGLLDVAGFKKPSYYFRMSMWSDKPMVKLFAGYAENLTDHRRYIVYNKNLTPSWNFIDNEEVEILCFTNCVKTELFLNGRSLGTKYINDSDKGYLTWKVPFEKGELKAVSTDQHGRMHYDVLKTAGAGVGIELTCNDKEIIADGLDIAHVVLNIVDSDGNQTCHAQDLIHVSIEGPGILLGLENGNLEDTMPYALPYRRAYNGRLLIYIGSTTEKGIIRVRAYADKLRSCQIEIISR